MKKTLTVNLGGTVFNIDDDAYRLLDNYLSNLKMHFRKEAGADEIVDDIERRISELFAEKLSAGSQVITIADVEEVIARMGKPEDMEAEGESASADSGSTSAGGGYGAGAWNSNTAYGTTRRRLYRNPDDKMLGGVISGMAAYLGWDVTLLRLLLLVILICGVGTLIPVYIVCWLVIPEARTAAEKLSMRGEAVTVENIGKTVTDGFEKVANGVNDYMRSDKPRTFLQKLGDALVMIVGWFLKICLVIFAIICSPVLFVFGVVFVALLFAAIAVAVGGESENTARYAGINVKRVILRTMALSGAICGIAGFIIVGGASHTISTSTAGGRGFTAIIVSWLSKFNTFVMILVSFFLVFMQKGAGQIASQFNLNENASDIITGIILFFILGCEFFINYKVGFRSGKKSGR